MRDLYMKNGDAFLVGFSVVSRETYDDVFPIIEQIRRVKDDPNAIILGVGNKIDLVDVRQVTTEEAKARFSSLDPPVPYMETSAKTGENVKAVFEHLVRECRDKKQDTETSKQEKKCILQ